jgi:hypothetical protein
MPSRRERSPAQVAAFDTARKKARGYLGSDKNLEDLVRAREAGSMPEARRRQAESLSKTMRGRERSPAQIAAFDAARAKAHAQMIGTVTTQKFGLLHKFGALLRERDGDLCQLCLTDIDFTVAVRTPFSASVDHIIPVRAGGTDDVENLWLAHLVCNQRKGARQVGRSDGSTDIRKDPSWV